MKFQKFFKRHTLNANQVIIKDNEMAITDVQRLKLAERVRDVFMGEAELLMAHLPYGGAERVATKDDLLMTELRILSKMGQQTYSLLAANATICALMLAIFKWG
ncbi:MAG: hypothetical protein RLZ18_16 [Actinomycetota bacterium]|jgi:hypothetical protein